MDNTIFAQSVARIKFLETKMLDKSKMELLTDAGEFSDCVRILADTPYGGYTASTYEEGLKRSIEDLYRDMGKSCPVKDVVDFLAARYDGHNIKALLKGKFSLKDVTGLLIDAGTIPADKLAAVIKEDNFRDMPQTIVKCIEKAVESYKNTSDPQNIDLIIDRGIFQYILEICSRSGMEYLSKIVKMMIDIINIKAFIRVKIQEKDKEFLRKVYIKDGNLDFDIFGNNLNDSLENFCNKISHTDYSEWVKEGIGEYIKNGDAGSMEKHGDNFIVAYIRKTKFIFFGPEPIIAYILARENEIRAIRIILTGKKNGVQPDFIRERLRDLYV